MAQPRELELGDPVRMSLMDLARDSPTAGLSLQSRLTFNRLWVENSQARLCGLATRADGDLLVQDRRLQMKRMFFLKHGSRWEVDRSERIAVPPEQSVETACGQRPPEAVMTAAVKDLGASPPSAGIPSKPPVVKAEPIKTAAAAGKARCDSTESSDSTTQAASPDIISLPGRSLLHSAPDLACFMGKHIVARDKVMVLAHMLGWTFPSLQISGAAMSARRPVPFMAALQSVAYSIQALVT